MFLLVSLLAGCSAPTAEVENEENTTEVAVTEEVVTLNYMIWNKNQEPFTQEIIAAFETTHPNIKVNVEVAPYQQYMTKLETSATGGSAPDIFWMNGDSAVKYARGNALMPLDENVKNDNYDLSQYSSALIDLYTVDGQLYGIPKDWDTIGLWYNTEMFDAAGISYPDETWNWEKLRETAKALTDADKGVWGLTAACTDQQGFYNTIFQSGGFVLSEDKTTSGFDDPNTIKGIECWVDILNDGSSPSLQQMTETKPADLFASGKVAMVYAGSWMGSKFANSEVLNGNFNVAPLPKMANQGNVIHGLANVVYAQTQHPEEAWAFVKFLGGKEANEIQAKSGMIIPAYKPALEIYLNSNPDLNLEVFTDAADYATMYPCSSDSAKWIQVQNDYMKKVWAGEMSAEDACKEVAKQMNEILAEEQK
jgi:multiple sugar transport system substrate-binding protein